MDWQTRMNRAIDYIEANLDGEIAPEVAARLAECSPYEFQRLFSFLTHVTLGEYIRDRRLTLAGYELQNSRGKIIDIALKYGYESHAAFSRAFGQMHGCAPSSARGGGAVLKPFPKIVFENKSERTGNTMSDAVKQSDFQTFIERGYYVKENAPIYYTQDMDKTCEWFRDTLGWFADVAQRDEAGKAVYGCVSDSPGELVAVAGLVSLRGFHFFPGEPSKGAAGFIYVDNVDKFRQYVLNSGWSQISEIYAQPWNARECSVTTIDGCVLRVFETLR